MEQTLDDIAEGDAQWLPYLQDFYLGDKGLETQVNEKAESIDPRDIFALELDDLDARVRIGRYGPYLEQHSNGDAVRVSLPPDLAPAELNNDEALRLLQQKEEGPNILGHHPETGDPIFLMAGRFGPYVQQGEGEKPRRASLLEGMKPEAVTLETALNLLRLPRPLGAHPESGKIIEAGIGRFGPYVRHEKDFRSLTAQDNVMTVSLDRALALLNQPKGAGARKGPEALREIGTHPVDGQPIVLMNGRYGPYIKHGDVNAPFPRGTNPSELTLEQAVALVAARAAKGPSTRRKPSRSKAASSTEKAPARKTPTSKAKKTTTKTTKRKTPSSAAKKTPRKSAK
jgi:DNA topoisomerase I